MPALDSWSYLCKEILGNGIKHMFESYHTYKGENWGMCIQSLINYLDEGCSQGFKIALQRNPSDKKMQILGVGRLSKH